MGIASYSPHSPYHLVLRQRRGENVYHALPLQRTPSSTGKELQIFYFCQRSRFALWLSICFTFTDFLGFFRKNIIHSLNCSKNVKLIIVDTHSYVGHELPWPMRSRSASEPQPWEEGKSVGIFDLALDVTSHKLFTSSLQLKSAICYGAVILVFFIKNNPHF